MKPYVVRAGDYLAKVAFEQGVVPDAIWSHPKNQELASHRSPDILAPGDVLFIPESPDRPEQINPSQTNAFVRKVPKVTIHLVLHDPGGAPTRSARYCVEGTGEPVEGVTGDDGSVAISVPVTAREAILRLPDLARAYRLDIGGLDPITEPSGVLARLRHLGFCSDPSRLPARFARAMDECGSPVAAIRRFQDTVGLPATGLVDDATRSALLDAHGC